MNASLSRLAVVVLVAVSSVLVVPQASAAEAASLDWRAPLPFQTAHGVSFGGFMVVDSTDHVYACATPWAGYQLARVDPAGTLLWTRSVSGVGFTKSHHVAVDSEDHAIVTGYDEGAGTFKTVKFDTAGNILWNVDARYGIRDEAFRVGVDAAANVYVTGRSLDPATGRWRFQTIQYDPNGNEQWVRHASLGEPRAIGVTPDGRVAVSGELNGNFTVVCYDATGNQLWSDTYTAITGAEDLVISDAGDVWICGTGAVGILAGTVIRYDSLGNRQWVTLYNGPGGGWDFFRRLTLDTSGNVIAVGQTNGDGLDWTIVKLDPAGAVLWATSQNGGNQNLEWATAVTTGPDDAVYVTGFLQTPLNPLGGVDTGTVKFDANGNRRWLYVLPASGFSGANALDSMGRVVCTTNTGEVVRLLDDPPGPRLGIAPSIVELGAPVTFTTDAAEPEQPAYLVLTAANGIPLFLVAGRASLNSWGAWTLTMTVPTTPTFSGLTTTYVSFTRSATGKILATSPASFLIQ